MLRFGAGIAASAVALSCATAVAPAPTPKPHFSLLQPAISLLLPLSAMDVGYTTRDDGALTFDETASAGFDPNEDHEAEIRDRSALLRKNGFSSAAFRAFELPNGGAIPRASQVIVYLFEDDNGARHAVDGMAQQHRDHYWAEATIGRGVGESSRAVASVVEVRGGRVTQFLLWSSLANVMVQAEIVDDEAARIAADCIDLAQRQLEFLHETLRPIRRIEPSRR